MKKFNLLPLIDPSQAPTELAPVIELNWPSPRHESARDDHRQHRLRIMCFLPLNNERQSEAIDCFVEYLKKRRQDTALAVEGFTLSDPLSPGYVGYWYSNEQGWVQDRIILCIIDIHIASRIFSRPAHLIKLKETIGQIYASHAGREEEVWITAHQVFRHA